MNHTVSNLLSGKLIIFLSIASSIYAQRGVPNQQEMWSTIQKQEQEINHLQKQLRGMEGKIEATGDRMEEVLENGFGSSLSWSDKTSLGSYGELHYNNLNNQKPGGKDKDEIDFHRFVLFIGHDFTDRIRLFSELEIEHVLIKDKGGPGEVELEQAWIEIDLGKEQMHSFRAGLFLIPVGIMNETHEPPTFYGVERNNVENKIIPTTWWESGVGLHGNFPSGLSYDLTYTSGLAVNDGYGIRGGRQKGAKAPAEDGAITTRIKWTRPGIELASSFQFQTDITQARRKGAPEESQATLFEVHGVFEMGPLALRALFARWDLAADAAGASGADEQYGWYLEPSFKVTEQIGLFGRFSQWDTLAGDGSPNETDTNQVDVGINYWPHENVVFKFDYQFQNAPDGSDELNGFNLGVGYNF